MADGETHSPEGENALPATMSLVLRWKDTLCRFDDGRELLAVAPGRGITKEFEQVLAVSPEATALLAHAKHLYRIARWGYGAGSFLLLPSVATVICGREAWPGLFQTIPVAAFVPCLLAGLFLCGCSMLVGRDATRCWQRIPDAYNESVQTAQRQHTEGSH